MADFYERALLNHILSSQHPKTGEVVYNLALEMGGYKEFQDPGYFTCCIGTAMETHSKYSQSIYFHNNESLYAFQYIASKLNWNEKAVTITQQTQFPESQKTTFNIECANPTRFTFYIRYPYWCQSGFEVLVNGKKQTIKTTPGSFIPVNRKWKNGDVVEVNMPFGLRLETMPDDTNRVAIMYGPMVLAGELGPIETPNAYTASFVPILKTEIRNPESWVIPIEGTINTFKTVGVGVPHDVVLKPFYTCHDERYSVFWDMFTEESWKEYQNDYKAKLEEQKRIEALTLDFFQPAEMQPERDHRFTGENLYIGILQGRKYREAHKSWMSCQMKVLPNKPNQLLIEYWGAFGGSKTFDIVVDDVTIATENISNANKGSFFTQSYNLPQSLTNNKKYITVKFVAHNGHRAGPIFGVRTIIKN